MRRAWALGIAIVFGSGLVGMPSAGASCAGPTITVDRVSAAPGDVVEVRGQYFGTDCNDSGRPGPVLGDPRRDIRVRIVQDGETRLLTAVDATGDYEFVVRAMVPGPAAIVAGEHAEAAIEITAAASPVTEFPPPTIVLGGVDRAAEDDRDSRAWIVWGLLGLLAVGSVATLAAVSRQTTR